VCVIKTHTHSLQLSTVQPRMHHVVAVMSGITICNCHLKVNLLDYWISVVHELQVRKMFVYFVSYEENVNWKELSVHLSPSAALCHE